MGDQTWQEEQDRVNGVMKVIHQQTEKLQAFAGQTRADVVEIRQNFWEDVTVNLEDAHEAAETYASIRQQAEVLSEKERSHQNAEKQLKALKRLKDSPYFGRVDFRENQDQETEQIYLGTGSLRDADDNFLIYDWRAPISSLYYDYAPGPVRYTTPVGEVEGTMDLKRQFVVRNGQILSLFDAGITIGDELLQEVLGKQADGQMKSIVATIQSDQNRIIRNETTRMLIVQGAAGSGKTSAAMQRIAYLLYRHRETLRADNILLFSPNPIFKSYVATVLPELGEQNMQQATFQEYLAHRLGKDFVLEDPFTQMEYVHTAMNDAGYKARVEGIRYKASTAFMDVLTTHIEQLREKGMVFRNVSFRGHRILTAKQISERFYSMDAAWSIPNRMRFLTEWMLQEVKAYARLERSKSWVEEEVELLDKEEYLKAYKSLRKKKRFTEETFDDFDQERAYLADLVVKKHMRPVRRYIQNMRFLNVPAIYQQLFTETSAGLPFGFHQRTADHWPEICKETIARFERGELAYEDATPYLYLKERLEGFQTNTSIKHVFIDEAQDYSTFQFAFIKHLFPRSRITALGDSNQSIFAHSGDGFDLAWLTTLYGEDQTATFVLGKSYRSTRQIVEFTRQMVSGGDTITPFQRDGRLPTVTQAGNPSDMNAKMISRVKDLQREGFQHIAILCKTAAESQRVFAAMKDQLPVQLVDKETAAFKTGTVVVPTYLAKGVEYDAVIVYDGSNKQYGREADLKLLYTACTRAMHSLDIYYMGDLSPFISSISPELYTLY